MYDESGVSGSAPTTKPTRKGGKKGARAKPSVAGDENATDGDAGKASRGKRGRGQSRARKPKDDVTSSSALHDTSDAALSLLSLQHVVDMSHVADDSAPHVGDDSASMAQRRASVRKKLWTDDTRTTDAGDAAQGDTAAGFR